MVRFTRNIKTLISVVLAASLASSFTFTAGAVTKKAENDEIVLAAESAVCTGKYNLKNDYDGKKGISIYSGEESAVSWNFNANAGKYTVTVVYHTEQGSGIDIQRSLKVNGAYPVDSAAEFHLHRCWTDVKKENGKFLTDTYGNELRPSQTERFCWMTQVLRDYVGYDSSPITVTLKDGANTISLGYIEEPVIIGELRLQPTEVLKSYAEISKQYAQKGYRNVCDKQIVCEGENSAFKTDPVLYPGSDRTNADVSNNNPYLQIINKIGGTAWNTGGQKIAWNIEAPESGLYRITFKVRKNSSKGLNAYRRLYIDGSVPFAEADALAFPFMNEWTNQTLGDKNGDWLFYLEKGRHEIALEATYGEMSKILEDTKNSLNRMNTVYRRILVVTGTEPDLNRNYHFDEIMPDVVEQISEEYKTINEIFERALAISGEKGESFTSLDATMRTLKNMVKDSSEIAKNLSDFKTNIGSLGTWLNTVGSQYIEIDRLYVDAPDLTLPSAQKPFFARLWFGIRSLIASYVIDYNSIGDSGTRDKNCDSVSVWITDGREQYQALKALVNNDFIPNRKIPVELKLVSAGILLPSIVAGVAPDVNIGTTDVVNLALRNAVVDLSQFSDFEDIVNECFSPEETVPFRFNGGVYAMPETVTFPVLFYRKDILNELSLDVPQTWGDVTRMISVLNKNNMTFGLGTDLLTYFMFLSQNGVALYSDSGSKCTFGSEDGVRAFRTFGAGDKVLTKLNQASASLQSFDAATYRTVKDSEIFYALNPEAVTKGFSTLRKFCNENKIPAISFSKIATDLNSDYNESNEICRQKAGNRLASDAEKAGKDFNTMLFGGNMLTARYAGFLTDLPLCSDREGMTDYSVPFLEMALSGHIAYSGPSVNLDNAEPGDLLRYIESAAAPSFTLTERITDAADINTYNFLYASEFSAQRKYVTENYAYLKKAVGDLYSKRIVSHERIRNGVFKTVFENGEAVVVNYNDWPCKIGNQTVEAESYLRTEVAGI